MKGAAAHTFDTPTTLFVQGIPFEWDDTDLRGWFLEFGFQASSARVVIKDGEPQG